MTPDRKAELLRLMTELRRLMAEWSAFRATLAGADLTEADLGGAPLEGANLSGANLSRANLEGADLEGAKGLDAEE